MTVYVVQTKKKSTGCEKEYAGSVLPVLISVKLQIPKLNTTVKQNHTYDCWTQSGHFTKLYRQLLKVV